MGTLTEEHHQQNNTLICVEELLNEFYSNGTSNVRKHGIEAQLQQFQNTSNSWQICLHQLTNFNNQYFWFFNVSTIEMTITRKWASLNESERQQIRDSLWSTYANYPIDIPTMQRDKIAQLISLIGKRQFPDEHPDYMNQIVELLESKFILGITLLRAMSEELSSTKHDIPTERLKYLNYCISMYLPSIFTVLDKYLVLCACRLRKVPLLDEPNMNVTLLPDDSSRIVKATVDLLVCIQQIFTWADLGNVATVDFFTNLFELAKWNDTHCDVPVSAITSISELFYRQKALPLPMVISTGMMGLLQQPNLKKSNELYQDKLTELLRLFTCQQWPKLAKDPKLPATTEFLSYLYQYTFHGYGALAFTERLAIWTPIIKSLNDTGLGKFSGKILELVSGILKKMLFQYDQDMQLEVLDNEDLDDDLETELQHFQNQCIDTIALVAEIAPSTVFDIVFIEFNKWEGPIEVFKSLLKTLSDEKSLAILNDSTRCHYLHCMLRDLTSLCQTIARICTIFYDKTDKINDTITSLTINLMYSVKLATNKKFYTFDVTNGNGNLMKDFTEAFAQIISALKSLLLITNLKEKQHEMTAFIDTIVQLLLPPNSCIVEPKIITLAAAQLLLSISSTLRPKYLIENRNVMQLVHMNLSHHLDQMAARCIQKMICNCFLLPWNGCTTQEQNYERRFVLMQEYIAYLSRDLIHLDLDHTLVGYGQEAKVLSITGNVLTTLKDLLDYYQEQSSNVKQILAAAYKPVIEKTLNIYSAFSSKNVQLTEIIFDFCLSTIRTLQTPLGQVFLKNIIVLFVEKMKSEQMSKQRHKALEKLLRIFLLIAEQPGNGTLICDILSFSIDHILPMIYNDDDLNNQNEDCESDVPICLYQLFDGVLQNRWQYFYKSNVLKQFGNLENFQAQLGQQPIPEHADQLTAIMNSYGRAIVCANDPHITRCVLESLNTLNERWKLYQKEFFKHYFLQSFEVAIIKFLISPEGILHYDLLKLVLFNMGQVDVKMLHETFMSIGYSAELKIVEDICLSTDLPTFSQHMEHLIQETKCSQNSGH